MAGTHCWTKARRTAVGKYLARLSETFGAPGFEAPVADLVAEALQGVASPDFDHAGNVYFECQGTRAAPRIVLPAHMDEIAFLVSSITDKGFLRFLPLGGWHRQALLSQRVQVMSRKGACPGVIGAAPPHLRLDEHKDKVVDMNAMFIDVGASSRKDAETRLGIRIGDAVVPRAAFEMLAGGHRCLGKAFDNRVGLVVMTEVLKDLHNTSHPNTVIGCGTVQEEVGTRGAKTVPAVSRPDLCLVLEASVLTDTPGARSDQVQGELGKGPLICVMDKGLIPHTGLRDFVTDAADSAGRPYQLTSLPGGTTDATEIQHVGRGIPSLYIGVPTRYVHTASVLVDIRDIQNTVALLVTVLRTLDKRRVSQIRRHGNGRRPPARRASSQ